MPVLTVHDANGLRKQEFEAPKKLSDLVTGIDMPCGGRERCLKCRVRITGAVSEPGERERALLGETAILAGERYACMTTVLGDAEVYLPEHGKNLIVTAGEMAEYTFAPWTDGCGIAVDIGTTTVAAYLYDLASGTLRQSFSIPNPQAPFGADVVSRMDRSMNGQREEIRKVITNCLSTIVDVFAARSGIPKEEFRSAVITGNTAMLYLLTGRDPAPIAKLPFVMDHAFGEFVDPAAVGMPQNTRTYLMKCMSAYVGADISAAVTAAGLIKNGELADCGTKLLVDIGTNGEMALTHQGKMFVCSTAAGPAFEGAGIRMGMTAREGAISRVDYADGAFTVKTVAGEPKGLCGTGVIDAVAAMLNAGVIDETGLILDMDHDFEDYVDDDGFTIPGTSVIVTQADVRAIQLAKSAICAGMKTLMHEAGVKPDEVSQLIIAGGFGSFIRPESAERVGLIPEGFAKKAHAIGNAAGAGASMTLLSRNSLADTEVPFLIAKTVDLSTNKVFMNEYVNGMMFVSEDD